MSSEPSDRQRGVRLALLGTVFFSTSAVLVRSATGFAPLEVASYRLILGSVFIALIALWSGMSLSPYGSRGTRHTSSGPGTVEAPPAPKAGARIRKEWLPLLGAAVAAAVHFAFYIGSLYRTSITHSLVLVNLSPVLALPLTATFLGERFERRRLPGVFLTIAGIAVMVGLEPRLTPDMLVGDAMALLAALAYAVYSVIGRTQRRGAGLLSYTFWVYLVAGVLLLPAALLSGGGGAAEVAGAGAVGAAGSDAVGAAATGAALAGGIGAAWTLRGAAAVVLLALLPTAGGHTLYNAALRATDAVTVNLIATQEVTGGVLLGAILLGDVPSVQAVTGGLMAVGGLWMVLRPQGPP